MKKIVTILLTLVLVLAMSTTAFAATIESNPGSQDIDVSASMWTAFPPPQSTAWT